ncbi:MAG: type VI secretion system contractile sheath large subunit, partial [Silvanigrellaceae bacterium]|nr:type VI secretion system contractile sheath large subunit [Silvanigrellaceae bacterium]
MSETQNVENLPLLEKIIHSTRMAKEEYQVEFAKVLLRVAGKEAESGALAGLAKTDDIISVLQARVAQIDSIVSAQVNEILHHEDFQRLEASWTAFYNFINTLKSGEKIIVRVLNTNKKDLLADLTKCAEFDQSGLFKKIYEEEYGTLGGHPFSFLVSDFSFGRGLKDLDLLRGISQVASAAHTPFVAAASASMFDLDSFRDLEKPRDLKKIFESVEMGAWTSFRLTEDAKYITLTLPRIIHRLPYGPKTVPIEEFYFVEDVDGSNHNKYLWGTPAFALAQRITDAFYSYGWMAAIRGVETGGLVQGLPVHTFTSPEGENTYKCPVECVITDRREKELNDVGFIGLCYRKNSSQAVFFSGRSFAKVPNYKDPDSKANAFLGTQLPYNLVVSRFAHYIKAMM